MLSSRTFQQRAIVVSPSPRRGFSQPLPGHLWGPGPLYFWGVSWPRLARALRTVGTSWLWALGSGRVHRI